eukprot:TRINITY_DN20475_c2_g2_i4.p1 TRINITY_DN20475_c2_g2~~TRINITY_DN20475_c2_g2_i4.p1  ORF type:complete len:934 (+),score=118.27 TRINITY_DN20475_c2_g2_i4:70-2871(+)
MAAGAVSPSSWCGSDEERAFLLGLASPSTPGTQHRQQRLVSPPPDSQGFPSPPRSRGAAAAAAPPPALLGRSAVGPPPVPPQPYSWQGQPLGELGEVPAEQRGSASPAGSASWSPARRRALVSPRPPLCGRTQRCPAVPASCALHIAPMPALPGRPATAAREVERWIAKTLTRYGEVMGVCTELPQGWARAVMASAAQAKRAVDAAEECRVKSFAGGALAVTYLSSYGDALPPGWFEEVPPELVPADCLASPQRGPSPTAGPTPGHGQQWGAAEWGSSHRRAASEAGKSVPAEALDTLPLRTTTVTLMERQARERVLRAIDLQRSRSPAPHKPLGKHGVGLDLLLLVAAAPGGGWHGHPYLRLLRVLHAGRCRGVPTGTPARDPSWVLPPWFAGDAQLDAHPPLPPDLPGAAHWRGAEWRNTAAQAPGSGAQQGQVPAAALVLRSGTDGLRPAAEEGAETPAPGSAARGTPAPRPAAPAQPPPELIALSIARRAERDSRGAPREVEFSPVPLPAGAAAAAGARTLKRAPRRRALPSRADIARFACAANRGADRNNSGGAASPRRGPGSAFGAACMRAATPQLRPGESHTAAPQPGLPSWRLRERAATPPPPGDCRAPAVPQEPALPPPELPPEPVPQAEPEDPPSRFTDARFLPFASNTLLDITGGRRVLLRQGERVRLTQEVGAGGVLHPRGAEGVLLRIPGQEPGAIADVRLDSGEVVAMLSGELEPSGDSPPAPPAAVDAEPGAEGVDDFESEVRRQETQLRRRLSRLESVLTSNLAGGGRSPPPPMLPPPPPSPPGGQLPPAAATAHTAGGGSSSQAPPAIEAVDAEAEALRSVRELEEMTRILTAGRLRRMDASEDMRDLEARQVARSAAGASPTHGLSPGGPPPLRDAQAGHAEVSRRLERDAYSEWYLQQKADQLSPRRQLAPRAP